MILKEILYELREIKKVLQDINHDLEHFRKINKNKLLKSLEKASNYPLIQVDKHSLARLLRPEQSESVEKDRKKAVEINSECDIAKEIYYQTALIHEIKRELELLEEKLLKAQKQ